MIAAVHRCGRCHELKPSSEFARSSRQDRGLQNWCRACQRAYYLDHRDSNVARARENKRAAVIIAKALVRDHLRTNPCVDCGEQDPTVLDFDHLRDKRLEVTRMAIQGFSLATIQAEIEKCVIRCANCHRRRTAIQRGYRERPARRGLSEAAVRYSMAHQHTSPAFR